MSDPTKAGPPVMEYKCQDDSEANGRIPVVGEQRFTLTFALEDGTQLKIHMGRESLNHFESFIAHMMVDDAEDVSGQS